MKLWIILYDHRHGNDVWPMFQDEEPTVEQMTADLSCWEGEGSCPEHPEREREDEWISATGPFDVPTE